MKPKKEAAVGLQEAVNGVGNGACQPPKNSTVIRPHIRTMLAYSPIMKSRYGVEEYST